jgi:hypothetical protein
VQTEQELANIAAGSYGVEVITNTSAHTGLFGLILPLEDSQITALVSDAVTGNALAGETLPKGVPVRIPRITSITLASGAVLAYRQPKPAY